MSEVLEFRKCIECDKDLFGRTDKKFCGDRCRNEHNNKLRGKRIFNKCMVNISNALIKSRRILKGLIPDSSESAKVSKSRLEQMGFNFKYHTHIHKTKMGKTYHYIYDYGYLELDNDWYLIIRNEAP